MKKKGKSPWKRNKRKSADHCENFRWNKHAPFLASPICIGQAEGGSDKTCKKREPRRSESSFMGSLSPTHTPWGCAILCLPNKTLSCNQDVTLVFYFKSLLQWDRTEEITPFPDISICILYIYICIYPSINSYFGMTAQVLFIFNTFILMYLILIHLIKL